MLLAGTLSSAGEPQDFVTVAGGLAVGTATPSRVAPPGPVACHWQLAGLPLLELVKVILPASGVPEKLTDWFTGGPTEPGVKSATTGVSFTVIVRCTVSLEMPSLTNRLTVYVPAAGTFSVVVADVGLVTNACAPVEPVGPVTDQKKLVAPILALPSRVTPVANAGAPEKVSVAGLRPPLTIGLAATPPGCMPASIQLYRIE